MVFLGVNLAFTFDLVNMVNPTAYSFPTGSYGGLDSYKYYYFGFQSFSDAFTSYFGDGGALNTYGAFLRRFGGWVGDQYTNLLDSFRLIPIQKNSAWEVISAIVTLIIIANSIIPMLVIIFYFVLYLLYLICFAFMILSFIVAFFGGGFRTALPNTYQFDPPSVVYSLRAMMV